MKTNNEVKFAENLHEFLPLPPLYNLGDLPREQRDAVAEDFRRWRVCKEVFSKRFGCETKTAIERADNEIRTWLLALEPIAYRDDMRRRLNSMKAGLKK